MVYNGVTLEALVNNAHLTKRGMMLRIFIRAPKKERQRRLRIAYRYAVVINSILRSDPIPDFPPRLRRPIFDIIVFNDVGRMEVVTTRLIETVARFTGLSPEISA
ncbi:MAG: hypothetical protein NUV53_02660 [Patescibacteria group bacterium]|nr:hypothetical protein [Patescibacteria group bacterium]